MCTESFEFRTYSNCTCMPSCVSEQACAFIHTLSPCLQEVEEAQVPRNVDGEQGEALPGVENDWCSRHSTSPASGTSGYCSRHCKSDSVTVLGGAIQLSKLQP